MRRSSSPRREKITGGNEKEREKKGNLKVGGEGEGEEKEGRSERETLV